MPTTDCGFSNGDELELIGPTLYVEIGFDRQYISEARGRPNVPKAQWPALVDTGASSSAIDSSLAEMLRLPVVDLQEWAGIGGPLTVNIYLAQIHFPALGYTLYGRFAGVLLAEGGQQHRALIGRDFLRHCTMNYDGETGRVILNRG